MIYDTWNMLYHDILFLYYSIQYILGVTKKTKKVRVNAMKNMWRTTRSMTQLPHTLQSANCFPQIMKIYTKVVSNIIKIN